MATGDRPDAISLFLMNVNGGYSRYRHAAEGRTGRLWQGRFYACILEDAHWATAVRYVELNAVRARILKHAGGHRWSSTRAHLGRRECATTTPEVC